MKKLIPIIAAVMFLGSCSKGPTAGVTVSNLHPKANEATTIENTSEGGDITYIRMNGEGTMNNCTAVHKGMNISDTHYSFVYAKPGKYKIEVISENSTMLGGQASSRQIVELNIDDPAACVTAQNITDSPKQLAGTIRTTAQRNNP